MTNMESVLNRNIGIQHDDGDSEESEYSEGSGLTLSLEPNQLFRWDANGIQETLLSQEISPETPVLLPDGKTRLFRVEASYKFALSRPPTPEEQIQAEASPFSEQESTLG